VYEFLGLASVNQYLFLLGVVVLTLLVVGNAVKAYARWKMLGFSVMAGHSISSRLLHQYLHQPYAYFLQNNSAHLSKNILTEVHSLVSNVVAPFAEVVARLIIIAAILALLMAVDPVLAVAVGIVLGGVFAAVYLSMRQWLQTIGKERLDAQNHRYQIVNEALMGIKNIKLSGYEDTYARLYERPSLVYSRTTALSSVAGEIPRYAIEVIAFGGILLIVLYLLLQKQDLSTALPLISLYAVSGYRLMPSLQAALQAYSKIRFHNSVLDYLQKEITSAAQVQNEPAYVAAPALAFTREIEFRNVSFQYEGGHKNILNGLNFTLRKNDTMGLVGKTGSGKTTVVDLLLGLLNVTSGEILIDGVGLTDETRRAWQKNCAYVTQHIYLCDDTLRANIAFGIPKEEIDEDMLRRAAKMAAIDTMIEEMPQKYDTVIGENGVRLSGGQRQRIGLARALYLNRPVLVLDEATSALDDATEQEVMQAIDNLAEQKTIVIIAHRLQTLKNAGQIIKLGSDGGDHQA
jgi:ATP-binding cassette, subfamily B, bacterial PglK